MVFSCTFKLKLSRIQASTATSMKPSVEPPLDVEHLSPGSVLEAYYSTESCVSSNQDDSIGEDL